MSDPDIQAWLDTVKGQEWLNHNHNKIRDWCNWLKLKDDEMEWTQTMDWAALSPGTEIASSSYAGAILSEISNAIDKRSHP